MDEPATWVGLAMWTSIVVGYAAAVRQLARQGRRRDAKGPAGDVTDVCLAVGPRARVRVDETPQRSVRSGQ